MDNLQVTPTITSTQLKQYKKILRNLSNQFGYDQKTVQRAVEYVLSLAISQGGKITTLELVTASESVDALLHDMFDWTKSSEYREEQAKVLLDIVPLFIASNNKIYSINKD